jgi:hypothetical protein
MEKVIEFLELSRALCYYLTTKCEIKRLGAKDVEKVEKLVKDIDDAIAELKAPRWYTPERWEQRTGEPWPDSGAVYYRYVSTTGKLDVWRIGNYENIANSNHDFRSHNAGYHQIICATEAGPPPEN